MDETELRRCEPEPETELRRCEEETELRRCEPEPDTCACTEYKMSRVKRSLLVQTATSKDWAWAADRAAAVRRAVPGDRMRTPSPGPFLFPLLPFPMMAPVVAGRRAGDGTGASLPPCTRDAIAKG